MAVVAGGAWQPPRSPRGEGGEDGPPRAAPSPLQMRAPRPGKARGVPAVGSPWPEQEWSPSSAPRWGPGVAPQPCARRDPFAPTRQAIAWAPRAGGHLPRHQHRP